MRAGNTFTPGEMPFHQQNGMIQGSSMGIERPHMVMSPATATAHPQHHATTQANGTTAVVNNAVEQQRTMMSNSPAQGWHATITVRQETMPFENERIDDSGVFTQGSDGFASTSSENSNDSHSSNPQYPTPNVNPPISNDIPLSLVKYNGMDLSRPDSVNSSHSSHLSDLSRSPSPQPGTSGQQEPVVSDEQQAKDDAEYLKSVSVPRVNAHGKIKLLKCKHCNEQSVTKVDFWTHYRVHIKPEKILQCQRCPFITEYKHHLEYHLRNHFKSKPFKCGACNYTCVNKSMLNSHKKSHLDIYQYRCATCNYVTKYCHSLKLHLRKYKHQPDIVLNTDGSPNPLPIIDVYGTRRGPKQRTGSKPAKRAPVAPRAKRPVQPPPQQYPYIPPNHFMLTENPQTAAAIQAFGQLLNQMPNPMFFPQTEPLRCMQCEFVTYDQGMLVQHTQLHANMQTPKNRRKGRAVKVEQSQLQAQYVSRSDDEVSNASAPQEAPINMSRSPSLSPEEHEQEPPMVPEIKMENEDNDVEMIPQAENNNNHEEVSNNKLYVCDFCDIVFKDVIMYAMHKGYHDLNNPFRCNMCGENTGDKVSFFVHIARTPHF